MDYRTTTNTRAGIQARWAELFSRANLIRMHRFAGLTLAVFIGIHLGNHLFALHSPEAHIKAMDVARLVYRNPVSETLLFLAILVQVPSGIMLARRKGWKGLPRMERLQVASGLYLSFFLVAHVMAVGVGRYVADMDTNFYFASAPFLTFPVKLFFIPYYGLSVVAVFSHVGSIHYQKMLGRASPGRAKMQAAIIIALGVVVSFLIVSAFAGAWYSITLPSAYRFWWE